MVVTESIFYLGKPYEGKPHVRFDEGSRKTGYRKGVLRPCPTLQSAAADYLIRNPPSFRRTDDKVNKV